MNGTIDLDDMRLFAAVAQKKSFTQAAQLLGVPKQTLSRRVAGLERSLGVQLIRRTTRKMQLTDVGAAYAERCTDIVRRAEDAARAVTDAQQSPKGVLRVTADPVFGEAFVTGFAIEYAQRFPEVELDVVLTRRHVDLIEEGFDIAFRVGHVDRAGLTATPLLAARVQYCASPSYLAKHGAPETPEDLAAHDCILVVSESASVRWPIASAKGLSLMNVNGRLRFSSFEMAHRAALAGLGIAIFPEFKCADDIAKERLVPVLNEYSADVGSVMIVHPTQRFLAPRVRQFVELSVSYFRSPNPVEPVDKAGQS